MLVLVLGLLATAAAGLAIHRLAVAKDNERFANVVAQASGQIQGRLETYVAMLQAGAGLFAANEGAVSRGSFHAFTEQLDLHGEYPGIQGLGFSLRTPDAGGPQTRALLAQMDVAEVQLRTAAAPDEEVHAIVFLEPLDRRNRAAVGFDMFAEPGRRAAMARARDTGRAAMSSKVELVQEIDERKQAGFLIYQPVYRGGGVPDSVAARRAALTGFVYAPFRADDLLAGIFAGQPNPRVAFAIYDEEISPANLLHRSFGEPEAAVAKRALASTRQVLRLGGRDWHIVYYATPGFELGSSRGLVAPFVAGGLLATFLLTGATWRESRARRAAEIEVEARAAVEGQRELLIAELNHRVKNALAAVQSIAAQTLRRGGASEHARESFEARLLALSHAHDLLTRRNWEGVELVDLVRAEVAPYAVEQNLEVDGPPVKLGSDHCVAVVLALHELATNAAKYGALSRPGGRLHIGWRVEDEAGGRTLSLLWQETGGPPVRAPQRRGFGSRLIEQGLSRQLGGRVELEFRPEGVRCEMRLPLGAA